MITLKLNEFIPPDIEYIELKIQENRSTSLGLLNGSLVQNDASSSRGLFARSYRNGMWGTASSPLVSKDKLIYVINKACNNTDFLINKMKSDRVILPSKPAQGEHYLHSDKKTLNIKQKIDFLADIDNYIQTKYPEINSRYVAYNNLEMEKNLLTNNGSDLKSMIPRSGLYIIMTIYSNDEPIKYGEIYGGLGHFEDHFNNPQDFYHEIDQIYSRLTDKKEAVFAKAGTFECILDPKLAGILAHEAIGHTTEGDIVINGSIAGDYLDKEVASPLISLVDAAHHWDNKLCPIPIFIDDEGTEATDCTIIKDGYLKNYMTSKETALKLGKQLTGNARSFGFSDEPIVRMRNTLIIPGNDKLKDMISSVENGYYLISPGNGQADYTSEFMFGVTLGYEIKNGKLGKAIKETTISGVAFNLLKTVSMISDDVVWTCHGMCGKKQSIPVGMGGPAIKCQVNIGGK